MLLFHTFYMKKKVYKKVFKNIKQEENDFNSEEQKFEFDARI